MEEIAFRLNPTQGLVGMDKTTRVGIRLRDLMAERAALAPVLADHHARLERISWAVYRVQRAILTPTTVARRIVAIETGSWAAMEAAIDRLSTTYQVEELGGVRRAAHRRRGALLPTQEEFYVAAPYIGPEKHRSSFWRMWAQAG
ncbi:hypothetical protein [Nonomuraea sp. NPDC005650]|uniref:hypothetical protein n=1 Tax=Nonomuraea sp. NPDC005650 TaxID=3157045 RepID=UPI0033AB753B